MIKIDKLDFKNPIIDMLAATIIGLLLYIAYREVQMGVVLFAIPTFVLLFFIYDRKCFYIVIAFIFLGVITSVSFYSFGENRSDIFTVRIEEKYDKYYMVSKNGKEFYLYSNKPLEVDSKVTFAGKFKEDVEIDRGRVGHLFLKKFISEELDFVYKLRSISENYFNKNKDELGESKAAILTALIFGDKEYIEDTTKDDFKNTGILHLICISGFHIAFLYSISKKLMGEYISLIFTLAYVILVGLTASAVRAFIMLLILALSKKINKNYNSVAALAFSALLLILIKPAYIFDLGFLLSYFATLGIFLFSKSFLYVFRRVPEIIAKSISMSFSAQVFVYPLLIIYFGEFSLNFLLGSLFLTPVIYIIMPLGIISVILFLFNLELGILTKLLKGLLYVFESVVEYLKFYSLDSFLCDDIFAVIYLLIFMVFYFIYNGNLRKEYVKINYVLLGFLLLSQFSVFTTIELYEKNFSSAIIIRRGFERVAYTNSESDYFLRSLKNEYRVNEIVDVDKSKVINYDSKAKIIIKEDIDESFIMLRGKNCGIIDLLNKDEKAVLIKDRIYIDERGI